MEAEPLLAPGDADDAPSADQRGSRAPDSVPERWWGRPVDETRAWLELGRLLVDPVFHGSDAVPRGDGRPVILLPGFLAGDQTLEVPARRPDRVSHAISMDADLQGMFGASAPTLFAVRAVRGAVRRGGRAESVNCLTARCGCRFSYDFARQFPVAEVPHQHLLEGGWRRPVARLGRPRGRVPRGHRKPHWPDLQPHGLPRDRQIARAARARDHGG